MVLAEVIPILGNANLALFLVGVGLSVAAQLIWKQKLPGPVKDNNPSTQVERGSFVPIVIGRARVAPIIGFISEPIVRSAATMGNGGGGGGALAGITRYLFGVGDAGGKRQDDGGSQRITEYTYKIWHIVCVGPVQQVHQIWYNGGIPLYGQDGYTPIAHQAGDLITPTIAIDNAVNAGNARFYWGFPDQPKATELKQAMDAFTNGNAPDSRWPLVCHVFWESLRVGNIKQVPLMEYEVSVVPQSQLISSSPMLPERWHHSPSLPFRRCEAPTNQNQSDGRIGQQLGGGPGNFLQTALNVQSDEFVDVSGTWRANDVVYATGPFVSQWYGRAGVYLTLHRARTQSAVAGNPSAILLLGYPAEELGIEILNKVSFTNGEHRVYKLERMNEDGCNLAHALDQIMFAPYPHGSGLQRELFDIESLEEIGRRVDRDNENLPGSLVISNGEDAQAVVSRLLQDMGVMLTWDPILRKMRFFPVRDGQTQAVIPSRMFSNPYPEISSLHEGSHKKDRITFSYRQRTRNYRNGTFKFDDDGRAIEVDAYRGQRVDIQTVANYRAAQRIAVRRSLEVIPRHSIAELPLLGAARLLFAGRPIRVDDTSIVRFPLRVDALRYSVKSGKVTVKVFQDLFAHSNQSDNLTNHGGAADEAEAIEAALAAVEGEGEAFESREFTDQGGFRPERLVAPSDQEQDYPVALQMDFYELPRYYASEPQKVRLLLGWIRANNNIGPANVYLSPDDQSYTLVAQNVEPTTGGTLATTIAADDPWVITDSSVVVTPVGPDLSYLGSFVSDDTSWNLGRLMMKVNDEIFYVKGVAAHPDGSGNFYVDSVKRARLGTSRAAHQIGDKVTFMIDRMVRGIADVLLQPGRTVYVKTAPTVNDSELNGADLSVVSAETYVVQGAVYRPMDPAALRLENGASGVEESSDAVFKWNYRNPNGVKSGAGMQGAGDPVQDAGVDGEFVFEVWDSDPDVAGTVIRQVTDLTSPTYTYTRADRTADGLGSDPFYVSVYGVRAGFKSNRIKLGLIDQYTLPL